MLGQPLIDLGDLEFIQVDPFGSRLLNLLPLRFFKTHTGTIGDLTEMLTVIIKAIENCCGDLGSRLLVGHEESSTQEQKPELSQCCAQVKDTEAV